MMIKDSRSGSRILVPHKSKPSKQEVVGVLGVGFDGDDGHQRFTRADDVVLVGGSQETHEKMQDVAIYFNESLEARGKRLNDAEPREVIELLLRAMKR
jgi:hypothetical protein